MMIRKIGITPLPMKLMMSPTIGASLERRAAAD